RRLAQRVLAIQMALEGADFVEVYRWFRERSPDEVQAFESTRRVFRGGVMTGGSPFLKDVVYLAGLLEVATLVRAAFAAGRVDCLRLLLVGKLDVSAIPALGVLANAGMCRPARYVPPWVADPRSVLATLTWSVFSSRIDLQRVTSAIERLLARTETIRFAGASTPAD
ncbi:MAG TPA: tyrosine/phenylalanine carboxypeptidase domain-containing protein, partial [Ilumatobacteraceae bacterium]